MAKQTEVKAPTHHENHPTQIDLSKYLPEGFDASGFESVGGFIPIVPAQLTHDEHSPVMGWIVGVIDMPQRESLNNRKGEKEDWQTIQVHLMAPTKALLNGEVLEIPPGKDVMIPINGSLKNNHELLMAACDHTKVYLGQFSVTGQQDTSGGKLNPMWAYDVKLHKQTKAREGRYLLKTTQQPKMLNQANGEAVSHADTPPF